MPGASGLGLFQAMHEVRSGPWPRGGPREPFAGPTQRLGRGLGHVTVQLRRTRWGWRIGARLGSETHFSHWWLGMTSRRQPSGRSGFP